MLVRYFAFKTRINTVLALTERDEWWAWYPHDKTWKRLPISAQTIMDLGKLREITKLELAMQGILCLK